MCLPSHFYAAAAVLLGQLQWRAKVLLVPTPCSSCIEYCMHRLICQHVHLPVTVLQRLHAQCPLVTKHTFEARPKTFDQSTLPESYGTSALQVPHRKPTYPSQLLVELARVTNKPKWSRPAAGYLTHNSLTQTLPFNRMADSCRWCPL